MQNEGDEKTWLTVKEFSKVVNVSLSYTRKGIALGRIRASNISLGSERSEWRIHRSEISRLLHPKVATGGTEESNA